MRCKDSGRKETRLIPERVGLKVEIKNTLDKKKTQTLYLVLSLFFVAGFLFMNKNMQTM